MIDYAEIRPILRQQAPPPPPTGPLMMDRVEVMAAGTGSLTLPNQDLYDPAIVGTDEDDIVLVFNSSGPSTYSSVGYTGRRRRIRQGDRTGDQWGRHLATDVKRLRRRGRGRNTQWCAISMNSATRGNVWCAEPNTSGLALAFPPASPTCAPSSHLPGDEKSQRRFGMSDARARAWFPLGCRRCLSPLSLQGDIAFFMDIMLGPAAG